MLLYKDITKHQFYAVIIGIALLQLLLAFQGFDVCDDGFVLTFYQQFFNHPESVEYNFLYWLTGLIGGIWYQLYEDGGILWFRFLAIIVNTATFGIAYRLLRTYGNKWYLIGALVMVLFVNDYGFLTFYHNHLTALATVVVIALLYKALKTTQGKYFILVGFLLGISIFIRLPNAAFISVLAVIPFAYYIEGKPILKVVQPLLYAALGIILGCLTIGLLLVVLGQWDIMKSALLVLVDLGNTEGSSHNFGDVLYAQYYNYKTVIKAFVLIFGVLMAWGFVLFKTRKIVISRYILLIVLTAFLIFWLRKYGIYAIYALGIFGSLFLIWNKQTARQLKCVAVMGLITLLVLPLGTGGGVYNAGYIAIWIGFPMFFIALSPCYEWIITRLKLNDEVSKTYQGEAYIIYALLLAFIIYKPYKTFNQSYFDPGSRLEKTATVNHPLTQYIYTTPERAEVMNSILTELKHHVSEDDYLLVYDNMPMLHFLTKTQPYVYNSWPFIYDYNSFEKKLKSAEQNLQLNPIVIQQKFSTILKFSEPRDDYMSTTIENSTFHNNKLTQVMNDFLKRNHYKIVWSNTHFNIYKSEM